MATENMPATAPPKSTPRRLSCCCVECGYVVSSTYRDYGKGNIRLTICPNCNHTVDKYVEFEAILIMIDLMLGKPQAYRHLLHNRRPLLSYQQVLKMFAVIVMLDWNTKAYLAERDAGVYFRTNSIYKTISTYSVFQISQLGLHYFILAVVENFVYMGALWLAVRLHPRWRSFSRSKELQFLGALCLSNFGKLFAWLTVIWEYNWTVVHVIGAIVVCSNYLVLKIYVNDETYDTLVVIAVAVAVRALTQLLLFALGNPMIFFTLI
ncbi:transmembrane protein [Achlya hypogyna]|uniref:Protein ARV n=1 Tax=Achlya hypogyna TaxID=1202772 RepID=A0A1V9YXA7_ACHHY|nr:transmembrane protein [Achlya hypogyna]